MKSYKFPTCSLGLLASVSVISLIPSISYSQSAVRTFNIPARVATIAIPQFADQSGMKVLAKASDLEGITTNPVTGSFAADDALALLLNGSGLVVKAGANGTVLIVRASAVTTVPARAASPAGPSIESSASSGPETVVVVTGLRGSLKNARALKRDSDAITDSIVAQDIGKLPDQNIAEAAQRIPGVQLQRYKEEGAGIAIRGVKQTKVVLDGREVYGASAHAGEYNGRGFDLEDLPAELLAGIDINKSSSANEIEGGLGGYVNIRTRKPFDFKTSKAIISIKATEFQMAPGFKSQVKGQVSALFSGRWNTSLGEMGVLVNAAHTESVFGTAEDEVQRTEEISNYAGSGKALIRPIGMFTGNGHHGDRRRDAYVGAFQWRVSDSVNLYADYLSINYLARDNFQTARFNFGTPTSTFTTWDGTNSDGSYNLKSGTFANNSLTDTSVYGDEGRKTKMMAVGGSWNNGGPLSVKAEISHNDTRVVNTLFEWGLNVNVPTINLTMNSGDASRLSISGVDLNDKSKYSPSYLLAIHLDGAQKNTAATVDAKYKFGDGFFRSVDFGLRSSDYTRHSFGFVDFYCIDGCASTKTLATVDPSLLRLVPATESRDVGAYWTYTSDAIRQQLTLRSLYGLPASEANTTDQDQLNDEKTLAAYAKVNWGFDIAGKPVTGNFGVRAIDTKLHGESYGTDPISGNPQLQAKDTKRSDVLPSFNAKLKLSDQYIVRLGASKTLGQVNFAYLGSATIIDNQVQHDAHRGNPNITPYTSRNFDLSLENYFSDSGMMYLGLFDKHIDGFIQTDAVQEVINGQTYNVSTYKSSGKSTIRGAEIGYQKFFDNLPAPFDGLGVQANYTYVESQAPSAVAGKTVPLEGLSKNSYNLVGMYEKGKIKARLAYNYRSEYVVSTTSSGAQGVAIFAAPLGTLDVSVTYDVSERLSLVFDGVNINGAHSEQYYGSRQNQMNYLPLNQRYGVQVRYSF